jgi:hypothetical protein
MNPLDDLISSSAGVPGVTPGGLDRGRAALDTAIAARAPEESPARRKAAAHWFSGLRGKAIIGVAGVAAVAAAAAIAVPSSPFHIAGKPLADSSAKPAEKAPAKPTGQTSASRSAPVDRAATPAVPAAASPWRLVYSTHFGVNAPLGSFSGCKVSTGYTCSGLPKALRGQWWAYGDGWPDTATVRHLKVHGYYSPSTTVWIAGGMMNIRIWRGTGNVHSAALLPKAALGKRYGKYVVTFRVVHPVLGYKSTDLLWAMKNPTGGTAHEIDFPEGGWGLPFHAFIHYPSHRPQFTADASFNSTWHTTVLEWSPHGVSFYCDGKLIGSASGNVADVPMRWVLQNETEDNGTAGPPKNSSSTMQIKYVAYYSWAG